MRVARQSLARDDAAEPAWARELIADQQRVEAQMSRVLAALARPCYELDARALSVIASSTEGRRFTSVDLLAHTRVDHALAALLLGTLGLDTPRLIGKFLRRLAQRPVEGFALQRLDVGRAGVVWRVGVSHE